MGVKDRTRMRADLRLDLKDSGALWSDAELDRCIERAFSDVGRVMPKQEILEETLVFTVTDESVTAPIDTDTNRVVAAQTLNGVSAGGTFTIAASPDVPRPLTYLITDANASITDFHIIVKGTDQDDKAVEEHYHFGGGLSQTGKQIFKTVHEVELDAVAGTAAAADVLDIGVAAFTDDWVYLANSPLKFQSETITNSAGTTTYTRDTDYYIDWLGGRIKVISGGSITAAQALLVDYTKSRIAVNISNLGDIIRIERVEYPVGQLPQVFVTFTTWADWLYVTGDPDAGQVQMTDKEHVGIYYLKPWSQPSNYTPSDLPSFLEDTAILDASAYALMIYVLKKAHQVATDTASARTALGSASTAHTNLETALTNLKKYLDNNTDADAAGILQDITDDAAELRTKIIVAADAANTYLDEVDTTDLVGYEGVWADEVKHILTQAGIPNAEDLMEEVFVDSSVDLVNKVNVGKDVPENFRRQAETALSMAKAWAEKRKDFLQGATARTNAAMGYVQEMSQRITSLRTYIEQSEGYTNISALFAREAEARVGLVVQRLNEAAGYEAAADRETAIADRFRVEAIERRNEAWSVWSDPQKFIGSIMTVPVRQSYNYDKPYRAER